MTCFASECLKRPSPCEGRPRIYLKHILRCIARIEEYTAGGRESFFASHLIQDGVIRNLQTLAESSQHLREAVRASQPSVDWKGLAGFRNVLVHDYLGIDLELVYRAVDQDVPKLKVASGAALLALDHPEVEARGRITRRCTRRRPPTLGRIHAYPTHT